MRNKIILGSFILSALAYSNSDNPSKRYLSPTSNYEKIFFTELETRDNERREELYSNILRVIDIKNNDKGERIPLTIADYDRENGTVTIVFQTVGYATKELAKYEVGDYVEDFVGPLGQPSEFIHEELSELKKSKIIFSKTLGVILP